MSEDNEFRALFLSECEELMSQLRDSLATFPDGGLEQINTAFRAVHSVKGGAAAFSFDELVEFAHLFEDRMAKLRDKGIAPDGEEKDLLVRGGDLLEFLIERAETGGKSPLPAWANATFASFGGWAAPGPKPKPKTGEQEAPAPEVERGQHVITVRPRPGFLLSGHDPIKLIRAARGIGMTRSDVSGDIPVLGELDPSLCPFEWKLTFEGTEPEQLREFFSVYDLSLDIEGLPPPSLDAKPDPQRHAALGAAHHLTKKGRTLRVELERIDRIVNLVGEIVIAQAALAQVPAGTQAEAAAATIEELNRLVREMQDSVMSIRAQPIKTVFSRMPRVVRDLSETLRREVRLEVVGEHTEVDTTVIEELVEPLTHTLRNAMDHGIESPEERLSAGKPRQGTITLSAQHRGEQVIISIVDDGRGISRDRVVRKAIERGLIESAEGLSDETIDNLIFLPGFSTSNDISAVSGRGVGMDVVKRKIIGLGGRCRIASQPGEGLSVIMTLPLTLAVLDGMVVRIAGHRFVIPLAGVVEAIRFRVADLSLMPDGARILSRRGQHLPVFELAGLLGMQAEATGDDTLGLIVETENHGPIIVIVESLIGQRQVVLKSLEANYRHIPGVSGATILGDGHVALILDVSALAYPDPMPAIERVEEVA